MLGHIICLHRALYKIHTWKLFVYGKIFARGKIKSGRKSLVKRKVGPKKKERVAFCQGKKKYSSMLTFRFRTKKSPSKQNLPNTLLKMRFPFLYSSASLDAKTWTIASNIVILKAVCRFVVLLPSTFSGFSIPAACFSFAFGNFAQYCVVLLNAPLSDRGEKCMSRF